MKKNKLLLVTALLATSSALFACNQNQNSGSENSVPSSIADSSSKETSSPFESNSSSNGEISSSASTSSSETKKTDEELFLIWKQGRDIALAREDDYAVTEKSEEHYDGILSYKGTVTESRGGNRYFFKSYEESLDEESGALTRSDQGLICIKEIDDNGKTRTKYYEESLNEEGNIEKTGSYVSPTYAENFLRYKPSESFDGAYIETTGDTLASFVSAFKEKWEAGEGIHEFEYLKFVENEDNSVTFSFAINYDYVNDYLQENDSDYSKSVCRDQIDIVAEASGIRSVSYIMDEVTEYSTKNDENSKTIKTYSVDYAFDEDTYKTISIDTETTENNYYGEAHFYLDGYQIENDYRACLVDEFYSLERAKSLLDQSHSFLITDSSIENRTDLFDLFLDEEFTQPFEGQIMTEALDLYIRLNTEKGAFVEAWFKVKGTTVDRVTGEETAFFYEKIKLVYHMAIGETFNRNGGIFEDYPVLEVDGQAVEEGYRPIFVCEEARIYKVLFDAGDTWM